MFQNNEAFAFLAVIGFVTLGSKVTFSGRSAAFSVYFTNFFTNLKNKKGSEGVKWELGFACFCTGKMGFRSLGPGFESEKKAKMGMGWVFC